MTGRGILIAALGWMAIAVSTVAAWSPGSAAAAAPVEGTETVEATASLIREMQFMLLRLGLDPGPIDGIVGPQTAIALRRFQERYGLPLQDLTNGGRVSVSLLARLRDEALRAAFGSEKKPDAGAGTPAPATPSAAVVPPAPPPPAPPDGFAACTFSPDDFRIGRTQYTPEKYLEAGFDGSTARAVSMLQDRLNEARQLAENLGGSALLEVQRQSRVLNYYTCRLKIEQASGNKN